MDKQKRKAIIAGNWKMNMNQNTAAQLITELLPMLHDLDCTVELGVPYLLLPQAVALTAKTTVKVGAQNCHWEEKGAFTGEISATQLVDAGAYFVILGHSERRQYFGETDETVNMRLKAALNAGLQAIVCVGESLQEREEGITEERICIQVKRALREITSEQMASVVFAYEPIWAIGTGKTATAQQAQEVCSTIRQCVRSLYGPTVAEGLTIQYGGSMNPQNAGNLLMMPDIDGGLIGGASLKAADFAQIVEAANR